MKSIVVYSSRGGNTQKVAEAIASDLGCEVVKITKDNQPSEKIADCDLVFVGTGLMASNIYPDVQHLLENLALPEPKRFALFITWGGAGRTDVAALSKLRTILQAKGQTVMQDSFACFGGRPYILMKRGHPNSQDLQNAKEWAKKQVATK